MTVQYLGLDDWLLIASAVLGIEAGVLAKAADLGTADSALNAPAAAFGGVEFYPDFATKAGILGFRLATRQPLPDGNKRTALLAMVEFIERNERAWTVTDEDEDDVFEMMVGAGAGTVTETAFVVWVAEHVA